MLCFLVLPCLPAFVLLVLDGRPNLIVDRIVFIVLAGLIAVLLSAALAVRAGRERHIAVVYGLTTAVLSVGAIALVIGIQFTIDCRGSEAEGPC